MSQARIRSVALALVVGLALAPTLTGCFGNPVESIVEGVTGGNVDLGGTSIPDDFPKDVPVYDGEVAFGLGVGSGAEKAWNVSIRVPDPQAIEDIVNQLTDAGFEVQVQGAATEEGASAVATSPTWGVVVVIVKDDAGFVANYTVTSAASSN